MSFYMVALGLYSTLADEQGKRRLEAALSRQLNEEQARPQLRTPERRAMSCPNCGAPNDGGAVCTYCTTVRPT